MDFPKGMPNEFSNTLPFGIPKNCRRSLQRIFRLNLINRSNFNQTVEEIPKYIKTRIPKVFATRIHQRLNKEILLLIIESISMEVL